jgi:hypothetical protein
MNPPILIFWASFEQENTTSRVDRETVRYDAASRPGAHDDDVELLQSRLQSSRQSCASRHEAISGINLEGFICENWKIQFAGL